MKSAAALAWAVGTDALDSSRVAYPYPYPKDVADMTTEEWILAFTLLVSVVALAQPWLILLWNRYRRVGKLEIYDIGRIAISFSVFGPTVRLLGTLVAHHHDQFVRNMSIQIVRQRDNATHEFDWRFFNHNLNIISDQPDRSLEIPGGIMVLPTQPHRFDILFNDLATEEDGVIPLLLPLKYEWNQRYYRQFSDWTSQNPQPPVHDSQNLLNNLFSDFSSSSDYIRVSSELSRICYWEPGRYRLNLRISVASRAQPFSKTWHFTLSPEHTAGLRANSNLILLEMLGRSAPHPHYWANVKYEATENRDGPRHHAG